MKKSFRIVALFMLSAFPFFVPTNLFGKKPIPLPQAIAMARKVFLQNTCDANSAVSDGKNWESPKPPDQASVEEFNAKIKAWGKYEIVDSRDAADIVIELCKSWQENDQPADYNRNTHVSRPAGDYGSWYLLMNIYDANVDSSLTIGSKPIASFTSIIRAMSTWTYKQDVPRQQAERAASADRMVQALQDRIAGRAIKECFLCQQTRQIIP